MNPDPLDVDPPAIVQPALFADRLTGLLAEARSLGRKTLEQKIACGKKLNEAFDEWKRRNDEAKPKDRVPWSKTIKPFGLSEDTAKRLRKAADADATRKLRPVNGSSQVLELDAIYDDGTPPDAEFGKNPCRQCRIRGKEYSSKCPACRAFNYKPPEPKEPTPLVDMDGALVPEQLMEAFRDIPTIRTLTQFLTNAKKSLDGLEEHSACKAIQPKEVSEKLGWVVRFIWNKRPGLPCPPCEGVPGKPCKGCEGRGWLSVQQVLTERAADRYVEKSKKNAEYKAKQQRSNEPLPE